MKLGRWLFMLWLAASALWLALVALYLSAGGWVPGKFEVVYPLRDDVGEAPPVIYRIDAPSPRPLYEIIRSPAAEKLPMVFQWRGTQGDTKWNTILNVGQWEPREFPDGARLWLQPALSDTDKTYIAEAFWAERWSRWYKLLRPFAGEALLPPLVFLLLLWGGKVMMVTVRETMK